MQTGGRDLTFGCNADRSPNEVFQPCRAIPKRRWQLAGNDSATVPRSAGQLERAVRKFSRTRGLAEKRVRDWISYMALDGRLEAASHARGEGPVFTFKGGVVMELRRQGAARATQDLDLTYLGAETDID